MGRRQGVSSLHADPASPLAPDLVAWLLESGEPWTRYRTLCDLLGKGEDDAGVQKARQDMLAHPQVQALIETAGSWPGSALKRHNDASHPLYALSTLADFGLHHRDAGMQAATSAVLAHQSQDGAFQSLLNIGEAYGGAGRDVWSWLLCDAPTLLYALQALGLGDDPRVQQAAGHLAALPDENGWRCRCAAELGKFRGPGRKTDPCPIANVVALKALALAPSYCDGPAVLRGIDMLLGQWEHREDSRFYLFGIGSDFRKLKYPFIWYDILHVLDVLSRYPSACADPRFREMLEVACAQAGSDGRFTAGSMYQAWRGWSFADKKQPSPWLTFVVLRVLDRLRASQGRFPAQSQTTVCAETLAPHTSAAAGRRPGVGEQRLRTAPPD